MVFRLQPTLVRYLPGGGIDASFGVDGIALPPFAGVAGGPFLGVALGPGGTLVAVGGARFGEDTFNCTAALIARVHLVRGPRPDLRRGRWIPDRNRARGLRDVTVLSDGRVLALAGMQRARGFESDGDLDPLFGGG